MSSRLTLSVATILLLRPWQYVEVAAATVLIYDYMLTLEREVRLIWPSSWNIIKVLFLFTRYAPLVNIVFVLFRTFGPARSETSCRVLTSLSGCMLIAGIGASQGILILRTWALWNRSKLIAIVLGCAFSVSLAVVVIIEPFWLTSINFKDSSGIDLPGCVEVKDSQIYAGSFVVVMLVESAIVILTVTHLIKQYRDLGRKTFFTGVTGVLYRDGIIFFVYTFGISLINFMAMWLTSHSAGKDLLINLQLALHTLLAARALFHLRETTDTSEADSNQTPSRIVFAPCSAD